ncbi:acyltransferase family protein [Verrucomicrobiota bacterium sgz303538]
MVETLERALSVRWGECRSGAVKIRDDEGLRYARANALLLSRTPTDVPQGGTKASTTRKTYYPGLALLRICAAIGVIQIHAGAQSGPWVDGFRALMIQERVPTFMLMALFLTLERQIEVVTLGKLFRRLRQLTVPLIAWMLIYDGSHFVRRGWIGSWETAVLPFLSPAEQLLGKGWHLYFLTWLAIGTVVAFLLAGVVRCLTSRLQCSRWIGPAVVGSTTLVVSCVLSLFSVKTDLASHVPTGGMWVGEQFTKLLSGFEWYALSAVPYVAIALLFHAVRLTSIRIPARLFMLLGAGAIVLNLVIAQWVGEFPDITSWVGAASGLVFGLSIPCAMHIPAWMHSAARASYGIFLSHVLSLRFYEVICSKISGRPEGQLDFVPFVAVVLLTFLTSWFVTVQLRRFAFTRRVLLGAD